MTADAPNFIIVSMDEVRPDHLSCYGSKLASTPAIDDVAKNGVLFTEAVTASSLTPVAHASLLTGLLPPRHGLRTPFHKVKAPLVSEYMIQAGYKTAAFVGVSLLGRGNGFDAGFEYFDAPREVTAWRRTSYGQQSEKVLWGNWWVDRFLDWIYANRREPFFVWAHYFECHEGAEHALLADGKINRGRKTEFGYYDAKIEYMDSALIGRLTNLLRELDIDQTTYIVITSDHGTNLGEHDLPYNKTIGRRFPQHVTLYECDVRVPLIIAGPDLPAGVRVNGMVRLVDILPTLLALANISACALDGTSLLPFVSVGEVHGLEAYSEELFSVRGPGDFQAIRTEQQKLIVDRRNDHVEFYDLVMDPLELENLVPRLCGKGLALMRKWLRRCDGLHVSCGEDVSRRERQSIEGVLRNLGYLAQEGRPM